MNAFFSQWDVAVILLQIIAIDLLLGWRQRGGDRDGLP